MISIIVPTRNEEEKIGDLLESIENNSLDDYEVVVVDGDSSDRTVEIAKSYGARVIQGPRKGTSAARNLGWKKSRGDYIMFLDADSELPADTLDKIEAEIGVSHPDIVWGDIETVSGSFVGAVVEEELSVQLEKSLVGKFVERVVAILT